MVELIEILLIFCASYFLGWVRGTERENAKCRRQLKMSIEEWEQLWND
tara:strand:+ start:12642 stop:12785 length:144 start_codon:yes stop_codon:yes gene_type:complete